MIRCGNDNGIDILPFQDLPVVLVGIRFDLVFSQSIPTADGVIVVSITNRYHADAVKTCEFTNMVAPATTHTEHSNPDIFIGAAATGERGGGDFE